jgi:hypothetical protein
VGNLRRSIEVMAGVTERSKLNTFGQLHSLMTTLVQIANSVGDSSPSRMPSNGSYRRSHSTETFLKNMIDKKMNKAQADFNEQIKSIRSQLPCDSKDLQISLNIICTNIIDQTFDELSELDVDAATVFRVSQRQRLRKSLIHKIDEILEINRASSIKETSILTSSFLAKIRPNRISDFADIEPEMFLRMKDFFGEFMKYFEEQSKDLECCMK